MATPDVLYFKDNASAFEYACRFTPSEVAIGVNAMGIVLLDSIDKSGQQVLVLRLDDPNRTEVSAWVAYPKLSVKAGDLVMYRLQFIKPEIPNPFDKIGVVGAKVAPEYSLKTGWKLIDVPGLYSKPSLAYRLGRYLGRLFPK